MEISLLLFVALVGYVYGGRQASLFQNRVISELKEIIDQGLSLSTPFNSSKEEVNNKIR